MADEHLRELERRFRETGADEDERAWLLARARIGERLEWGSYQRLVELEPTSATALLGALVASGALTPERLELAAGVGEPGARRWCQAARPAERPTDDDELRELARSAYLPFLNMHGPCEQYVRALGRALRGCPDPERVLLDWLGGHRGWRPDLVGLIGLLAIGPSEDTLEAVWRRWTVSWVSPQCAVVAYLLDPEFPAEARERIALEDAHPKALNALLALHRLARPGEDPAPTLRERLAAEDHDSGDEIALRWLGDVQAMRCFLPEHRSA